MAWELLIVVAVALSGCVETSYRTEVVPNGEGGVQVVRVPKPPEPPTPPPRPALVGAETPPLPTAPPAPPPPPVDPDLAQIEQLWPSLSPADRKTVLELTHRLAAPQ
jgi:hypothetical protein